MPLSKWINKNSLPEVLEYAAEKIKDVFIQNISFEKEWQSQVWEAEDDRNVLPHQVVYVRYLAGVNMGQARHCDSDAKFFTAVLMIEDCEDESRKGIVVQDNKENDWNFYPGSATFLRPSVWHEVENAVRQQCRSVAVFSF